MSTLRVHDDDSEVLCIGFNQDHGCFSVGTPSGFRIFNCNPYKETFRRDFTSGGLGVVEMLFRCNILAIVGGGRCPCFMPNKVMLWDDHQATCIGELSFKNEVKSVKLRRDIIVVVLETQVFVYSFERLELLSKFDTTSNPLGLVALSPATNNSVLACPAVQAGLVRVELFTHKKTNFITAHENALACLALTLDGTRLATASEKGTLIRVWDTLTGEQLQEVRRGAERAHIYSLAFSHDNRFFCCSSDRGTVHVFSVQGAAADDGGEGASSSASSSAVSNRKSRLSFLGSVLPFVKSEWSFTQFKVPEVPTICAFGDKNTIITLSADGFYRRVEFDTAEGSECIERECVRFLRDED